MFSLIFDGLQLDLRLALLPPLFCALFRLVFILAYRPKKTPSGEWRKWYHCFRYGFWWGMDVNAYPYLLLFVLVTLPAAVFPAWHELGNSLRMGLMGCYLLLLYTAFMAKLIFYFHFHDIFNHTIWLGKNADKRNFADIFFHQNHGGWILLSYLPYGFLCYLSMQWLLSLPCLPWPELSSDATQRVLDALLIPAAIAIYYWFHFGGTFLHRNKPEWDEVPAAVKDDIFMAKATLDDLENLKILHRHAIHPALKHSDGEARKILAPILPDAALAEGRDPLAHFRREAQGARIQKPRHIFLLFAESHAQAPLDPLYESLRIAESARRFRRMPGTVAIDNVLSGGMISQTSIVSMLSGIYDVDMELNENQDFWRGCTRTSLARQLRELGYRTAIWYGGSLTWGSLLHYTPAAGFDEMYDGLKICPKGSPRTWLGVYDHIFLENVARTLKEKDDGAPAFHFIYTTSNHGPYNIPVEEYGFDAGSILADAPAMVREDDAIRRHLGCYWYTDKVLHDFIDIMRERYPDSLFIVTGDHATGVIPFASGIVERKEPALRERLLTSFAMQHPELNEGMFAGNTIAGHMNLAATIMELIAPRGVVYYSLFPSLTEHIDHVVTPYCWMDTGRIGLYADKISQSLKVSSQALPTQSGSEEYAEERAAWCELTGWMVRHPELLEDSGKGNEDA